MDPHQKTIRLNQNDDVFIALEDLSCGTNIEGIILKNDIPAGHKGALHPISQGEYITKYGAVIGRACQDISEGEHVHSHNLVSALNEIRELKYQPGPLPSDISEASQSSAIPATFPGYLRQDGRVGIRNQLWIIPTVGCVNALTQRLAQTINSERSWTGSQAALALTHPYGCSQQGNDHATTRRILTRLATHPNAGGVLIVSLGCENNTLDEFLQEMVPFDESRVRSIVVQNVGDEYEESMRLLRELADRMEEDQRVPCPVNQLAIGLKCGGSDAFSGITANPLVGIASEDMALSGIHLVMGEVPEMFGGEAVLLNRGANAEIFHKGLAMIDSYKQYFIEHGCPPESNPSPGNKAGGITTLEEKSLGCIRKAGNTPVQAILDMGEPCLQSGLNLLRGPGNDAIAMTLLAASGVHIILFTTGRGTPLGSIIPTIKISSRTALAENKPHWIDFDAGRIISNNESMQKASLHLETLIMQVAEGHATRNETHDCREISLYKEGVIL